MAEKKTLLDELLATPSESFRAAPYKEMMAFVSSWDTEFPGVIMRIENSKTGKVAERYFRTSKQAEAAWYKNQEKGHEVTMITATNMHSTYDWFEPDEDDE